MGLLAGLVLALALLCLPYDPPRWTAREISEKVDLLNENSAVTTPHLKLGKETREANLALFEKVESGQPLSADESAAYRVLYQSILKDKQSLLKRLDRELTVLTDFRPGEKNNVGTLGIEGSHDHHDSSAGANFFALKKRSVACGAGEGGDGVSDAHSCRHRCLQGSHRPHRAHGHRAADQVGANEPVVPTDELQRQFESMMLHYKRAQFEPVNSPAYVSEVHLRWTVTTHSSTQVQNRIYDQLGPLERSLSGRWCTWRSLGALASRSFVHSLSAQAARLTFTIARLRLQLRHRPHARQKRRQRSARQCQVPRPCSKPSSPSTSRTSPLCEAAGVRVTVLDALEQFPDSIFVEDPALVFRQAAILLRPGAPSRMAEASRARVHAQGAIPRQSWN